MVTTGWTEDWVADVRARRQRPEAPAQAEASPVAKAVAQLDKREVPWSKTHDESTSPSNVQEEQVPLRLSQKAADLAADLRKGRLPGEGPKDEAHRRAQAASGDAWAATTGLRRSGGTAEEHRAAAQAHDRAAESQRGAPPSASRGGHQSSEAHEAQAASHRKAAKEAETAGSRTFARDEYGHFAAKSATVGEQARAHAAKPEETERGRMYEGAAPVRDGRVAKSGHSFETVKLAISAALRAAYPCSSNSPNGDGPWTRDVFDDCVVFELGGKLQRLPYVYDGVSATLGTVPQPVEVSYVPEGSTR